MSKSDEWTARSSWQASKASPASADSVRSAMLHRLLHDGSRGRRGGRRKEICCLLFEKKNLGHPYFSALSFLSHFFPSLPSPLAFNHCFSQRRKREKSRSEGEESSDGDGGGGGGSGGGKRGRAISAFKIFEMNSLPFCCCRHRFSWSPPLPPPHHDSHAFGEQSRPGGRKKGKELKGGREKRVDPLSMCRGRAERKEEI